MICKGITSLKESRVGPIYMEVAPVLGVFGKLFGKALEAQVGGVVKPLHPCHVM
jgi:hypothetical protein